MHHAPLVVTLPSLLLLGCSLVTDLSSLSDAPATTSSTGGTGAASAGGAGNAAASGGAPSSGGTGGTGGTAGAGGTGGSADPYTTAVLTDAPSAWWRLDDDVTPVAVDSGPNGFDGTYVNGVTLDQPGILPPGTSVLFDGVQGRVDAPDVLDFAGDEAFSIEVWIDSADNDGFIVGKNMHDGTNFQGWMLVYGPMGFRFQRHGSGPITGGALTPGTWNHVVGTFDGVTARLYVDSDEVDVSNSQNGNVVDHGLPVTIASGANWGRMAGRIDEVAVYDHILTPARVMAHHRAGLGR